MLLKIIYLNLLVASAFAAPPTDVVPLEKQQPTVIPIVEQSAELEANGTFKFSYETANGIKLEETSYDKVLPKSKSSSSNEAGEDKSDESNEIHVQQGSYSYTAPDGTVISVRYIADENGFRPIGDHLPKAPSILTVATARSAGKQAKAEDNAEGGSAPAVAITSAQIASDKTSKIPKIASRIAESPSTQKTTVAEEPLESSSAEVSTTENAATQESSASTTDVPTTAEAISSTEQSSSAETTATTSETLTSEAASTPEQASESSTLNDTTTNSATDTTESTPSSPEPTTEGVTSA